MAVTVYGAAEPFFGRYDYDEAFRQNPDQEEYYIPDEVRNRVYGPADYVGVFPEEFVLECYERWKKHHKQDIPAVEERKVF